MIGEEKSLASLAALSPKKQLAFALLVLERMLPSLAAFSKDTGLDASCYAQAEDAAWAALQSGTFDQALNQACIKTAPDTEDFSHKLASYALNAALALSDIAEFMLDGSARHIAHVSTLARDSVYLYISSLEQSVESSPEEESRVMGHQLLQREQRQQEEDIRFLSGLPDRFDQDAIPTLRVRASAQAPLLPFALNGDDQGLR